MANLLSRTTYNLRQTATRYWRRYSGTDVLVVVFLVVAATLIGFRAYEHATAGLVIQDAATRFCVALRDAQQTARNSNSFVRVSINPSNPERPCTYVIRRGGEPVEEHAFPSGVSVSGTVSFDPHGVPLVPSYFIFRKLGKQLRVEIAENGLISIPVP